ncbi:hypothetical protein AAHE18_20G230600 [Arachis hypogaea]|uniref:Uncharacterized protein n=2 Tax=Arachis TaxID=3817 RepID=A0A444X9E4_ARAHY|nr:hypothetical protein Ahy_B10g105988 [Arachis hypogaea]
MVVEFLCSENPMSPRISFSHDFSQFDVIPVERIQPPLRSNSSRFNSSIDFDFHIHEENNQTSSADELFSEGRIVPTEIKNTQKDTNAPLKQNGSSHQLQKKEHSCIHKASNPVPSCLSNIEPLTTRTNSTEENVTNNEIIIRNKETKELNNHNYVDGGSNSKSFWSFKRSSSCGSGYGRRLCPLPLLSRSNSTGSSPKRVPLSSSSIKQQNSHQKHYYSYSTTTATTTTRSSSSSSNSNHHHHRLKPPLKRSHNASYYGNNNKNSVRVNPVLNVPPVSLSGLCSIFSNNRDRSKKK